jgi:hypothetical protein
MHFSFTVFYQSQKLFAPWKWLGGESPGYFGYYGHLGCISNVKFWWMRQTSYS